MHTHSSRVCRVDGRLHWLLFARLQRNVIDKNSLRQSMQVRRLKQSMGPVVSVHRRPAVPDQTNVTIFLNMTGRCCGKGYRVRHCRVLNDSRTKSPVCVLALCELADLSSAALGSAQP